MYSDRQSHFVEFSESQSSQRLYYILKVGKRLFQQRSQRRINGHTEPEHAFLRQLLNELDTYDKTSLVHRLI